MNRVLSYLRFFVPDEIPINIKGDSFKLQKIINSVYELKELVTDQLKKNQSSSIVQ